MRDDRKIARVLAMLCLAGMPAAAWAFQLIEAQAVDGTYCAGDFLDCGDDATFTRWFQTVVPFWVNEDAAADATGSPINQAEIEAAAQDAFQAWEDVDDAYIRFSFQGTTASRIAADGINTTLFYNAAFDTAACAGSLGAPSGTLAITILTEDLPAGEITDADVVFDSADTWEDSTDCVNFDFRTTLPHEYGHAIGIHHTDLPAGTMATRPTMYAYYFCDVGIGSGRTLEADDEGAVQCLYPEQPTVTLMDQTGSMGVDNRMPDAQGAANDFIADFADNEMSITSFAQGSCPDGVRDGYELEQDWTFSIASLQSAVNATSACGGTPMWESLCCAVGKATERDPANVLLLTDTEENASDGICSADCPAGFCGCLTVNDALATASPTGVAVYVIDMTAYSGLEAAAPDGQLEPRCIQEPVNADGADLMDLASQTGGLYCSAFNPTDLKEARLAIQLRMTENAKLHTKPADCTPGAFPIDDVQVYDAVGRPVSPFLDQQVELFGQVTVLPGQFDPAILYVQDCSGGIRVQADQLPAVRPRDEVRVVGPVGVLAGENAVGDAQVEVVGEAGPLSPPVVDPLVAGSFELVGSLITVRGFAASDPQQDGRFLLQSDLDVQVPQTVMVFLDPDTGIDPGLILAGRRYQITGVLTRGATAEGITGNEVKPRMPSDVVELGTVLHVPGEVAPLAVSYDAVNGRIDVNYTPACDATDHTVYFGDLASVSTHSWSGAVCGIGTSGTASFDPGLANAFFVIVGENGVDEGSYGRDSLGVERPEDLATPACDRPQNLAGVVCE